jgi:hypothetical protein
MGRWIGSYGHISPNKRQRFKLESRSYPVEISAETPNFTDFPTEQLFSNLIKIEMDVYHRLYASHNKLTELTMKYARVKTCVAEESMPLLGRKIYSERSGK